MTPRKLIIFRGFGLLMFFVQSLRSEVNLSVGRIARQSNSFATEWSADKAVDGCLDQSVFSDCCAHTNGSQREAWWQVDLGSRFTISNITIYYRDEPERKLFRSRFAGFQIYLSNNTDWTAGVLCYEDTSGQNIEVELLVTHQCPYIAQYVTIYNYRGNPKRHDWYDNNALLELCEVQAFGCQIGKYGYGDCNQSCSDNCYGGNCDASIGSCFSCKPGKYGEVCDRDCPMNCNGTCDKDSGLCRDCRFGKWGGICDRDCSKICKDCTQNDGSCIDCSVGLYGQSCQLYCPTHCENDTCDRESGLCFDCEPGKHGEKCDLDCSSMCKELHCEKDTGFCAECTDGIHGYHCDKACPAGCNSNKCRRYDGTCEGTGMEKLNMYITVISFLATVAAICLVAAIIAFVCMQRYRAAANSTHDQEDSHYTDITAAGNDVPNTYEMAL